MRLHVSIKEASEIFINFSNYRSIEEIYEAVTYVQDFVGDEVDITFGTVKDANIVTLIATGIDRR